MDPLARTADALQEHLEKSPCPSRAQIKRDLRGSLVKASRTGVEWLRELPSRSAAEGCEAVGGRALQDRTRCGLLEEECGSRPGAVIEAGLGCQGRRINADIRVWNAEAATELKVKPGKVVRDAEPGVPRCVNAEASPSVSFVDFRAVGGTDV
ncbi:hypothetical protein NDU88_004916 [Pleurodeles waltl]|uniref:Uncharacterized protein n=1 Tax=Pleurodeles waltl TaxID=8319 RepID=A0AAV7MUV1_PLEWA|nr:hypothetical protein NDU88_004916 [Pleurodeles waltl]